MITTILLTVYAIAMATLGYFTITTVLAFRDEARKAADDAKSQNVLTFNYASMAHTAADAAKEASISAKAAATASQAALVKLETGNSAEAIRETFANKAMGIAAQATPTNSAELAIEAAAAAKTAAAASKTVKNIEIKVNRDEAIRDLQAIQEAAAAAKTAAQKAAEATASVGIAAATPAKGTKPRKPRKPKGE